jgi:integrase
MPKLRKEVGEPRTRGTGSIITKPNSRFLYIAYYDANGKQHQETTKSESVQVAEAQLRKRLEQVAKGVPVEQSRKLKYEDIRELLITDYQNNHIGLVSRIKKPDAKPYVYGFDYLDEFFRGMLVSKINSQVLRKFVAKLQSGEVQAEQKKVPKTGKTGQIKDTASNATINRVLAVLRRMMNIARADGLIQAVPHFPMLKEQNVRTGFVESEKFKDILSKLPEVLQPLVLFLYRTGCRVGAAKEITWNMVNADCTMMSLPPGIMKNKEPLTLPIPSELTPVLKKQFRKENQPVFDSTNLRKDWEAATKAAKCPDLLIHDLRRSGVRNFIQAGVPETVAMKITGHKTASVFRRYAIVAPSQIQDAMKAVEFKDGTLLAKS